MTKSANLQANRPTQSQNIQDQITQDLLNAREQSSPDRTTLEPTTIREESGEKGSRDQTEGLPLDLVLERDLVIEIEVGMIFTLEQRTVAPITIAGNLTQNTETLKTADHVVPTLTGTLTKTEGLRISTTEILKAAEKNQISTLVTLKEENQITREEVTVEDEIVGPHVVDWRENQLNSPEMIGEITARRDRTKQSKLELIRVVYRTGEVELKLTLVQRHLHPLSLLQADLKEQTRMTGPNLCVIM